jgi:hypothetical protein
VTERLQGLGEGCDLAAQAGYRVLGNRKIGSQSAALAATMEVA